MYIHLSQFTWWQYLGLGDGYLHSVSTETDKLVNDEDDDGTDEEPAPNWVLYQPPGPVHGKEDVEEDVEAVCEPEGVEDVASGVLRGEHEHDDDDYRKNYSSQTWVAAEQIHKTFVGRSVHQDTKVSGKRYI